MKMRTVKVELNANDLVLLLDYPKERYTKSLRKKLERAWKLLNRK